MALARSNDEFRAIVQRLADKYMQYHEGIIPWNGEKKDEKNEAKEGAAAAAKEENDVPDYNLYIPPWICQPYYRLPPEQHKQMIEEKMRQANERGKKRYFDKDGNEVSHKHLKKLKRMEKRAKAKGERTGEMCKARKCSNTKGLKCEFLLCRTCCSKKCLMEIVNCTGHKIFTVENSSEKMNDESYQEETIENKTNEQEQQQQQLLS